MRCRDHRREPCTVPRCQVLALCAASIPHIESQSYPMTWRRWDWLRDHRYPQDIGLAVEVMADRLVAWMRWPGPCSWCGDTSGMGVMDCGVPEREPDTGCIWVHRLDELLPYRKRIRALSSTCSVCSGSGWHPVHGPVQHELLADGSYELTTDGHVLRALHFPCDHDGIDWATVLVFLDWLANRGWTLQEVHEWRPQRKEDP